jgi:hopanoid biosynthesis associated RND transporter like protein HpnN
MLNLTLLPALIALTRPPGAPGRQTDVRLAMIDRYVLGHRRLVLGVGVTAAAICAMVLPLLHFDFNPIHLRSADVESVATLTDLMRDPDQSPNTLEAIRPSLTAADQLAAQFRTHPEVSGARTLSSFIPDGQPEKIALIADAADLLNFTLNPLVVAAPPSDAQVVDSLKRTAANLRQVSADDASLRADVHRLADQFSELAAAGPSARAKAAEMLVPGFVTMLDQIRNLLQPQLISLATLPPDLVREWQTPDGRARISITPKGDSNDIAVLDRFIAVGLKIAPDVAGTAITIQASGRAVVRAFIDAGALSFVAITGLLWIALRRVRDVAITMAPIVLTGLLTMGTCVLIRQPLNFANIIALPLLFGIGVAFHIYFVMAWRAGNSHLLTSSLARGVFFSALATATGFGSLLASSHPGTASMGKLLTISLVWTLVSALLFQPALMGPPFVESGKGVTASSGRR